METAYRPIPCAQHSELEVAVLRGERLEILAAGPAGTLRTVLGQASDLRTRDGAEFLLTRGKDGAVGWLRLDRLVRVTRLRDGVRLIGA